MTEAQSSTPDRLTAVAVRPDLPDAEALAERLADQLAERWQRGERPSAAELLTEHPDLNDHPTATVRLIYEEYCLRQEHDAPIGAQELLERYPEWRQQLQGLLSGRVILSPAGADGPHFPEVGDEFHGFRILAELGRGGEGRIYLAQQEALASRLVVLKATARQGGEHLSLARLQHTHIVPLYLAEDVPDRQLRLLCMPYLGGTSLAHVLAAARARGRPGPDGPLMLAAIDRAQPGPPPDVPRASPVRALLARTSHVQAICWVGSCLADALHYAHERGLVHLDVKPSNVLLAADGQPMLLDFHLARPPIRPEDGVSDYLGGTPRYMSPEQRAAVAALSQDRPAPAPVDRRSDTYSLGLMLYEALGGRLTHSGEALRPLHRNGHGISRGLSDIVQKCLAPEATRRYQTAAELADDLRRHLANRPLRGVPNHSLTERFRKWRRRTPSAPLVALLLLVLAAAGIGAIWYSQRMESLRREQLLWQVRVAWREGITARERGDVTGALRALERSWDLSRALPRGSQVGPALTEELGEARTAWARQEQRDLTDRLGFLYGSELSPEAATLLARGRSLWEMRNQISGGPAGPEWADLGVLLADLTVRLAAPAQRADACREALRLLDEVQALAGPSGAVWRERARYAAALGRLDEAADYRNRAKELPPRSAWERYVLGRELAQEGADAAAERELARVVAERPGEFWPQFALACCQYRLKRFDEAAVGFTICIALSPKSAECYFNRALAESDRGHSDAALRDYSRALELKPAFAAAAFNRALLHFQAGRIAAARTDANRALQLRPGYPEARQLLQRLAIETRR